MQGIAAILRPIELRLYSLYDRLLERFDDARASVHPEGSVE